MARKRISVLDLEPVIGTSVHHADRYGWTSSFQTYAQAVEAIARVGYGVAGYIHHLTGEFFTGEPPKGLYGNRLCSPAPYKTVVVWEGPEPDRTLEAPNASWDPSIDDN
jgi:hypothetical protein